MMLPRKSPLTVTLPPSFAVAVEIGVLDQLAGDDRVELARHHLAAFVDVDGDGWAHASYVNVLMARRPLRLTFQLLGLNHTWSTSCRCSTDFGSC